MTILNEKLTAYGANYEETMRRFLGKEELYKKFLGKLFEDNSLQQLNDALVQNNLEEAFMAAHTLKGIAGNMGLTPLYQAVCRIVEPLREKEQRTDYLEMLANIQEEFDKVDQLRISINEN